MPFMSSRRGTADGERLDVAGSFDPAGTRMKSLQRSPSLIARGAPPNSSPVESATVGKGFSISATRRGCFLRLVIAMEVGRCREGPDGRRRSLNRPRMHLLI